MPSYRGAVRDGVEGRKLLAAVEEAQGPKGVGRCAWPGCVEPWAQVDHILPRSRGGGHEPENLQGLCAYHNIAKGDGSPGRVPRVHPPAKAGKPSRRWLP